MVTEHNLALLGCLHVSKLTNENEMYPEAISFLKMNSCSKALTIARECRDILGGNGITEEYDIFIDLLKSLKFIGGKRSNNLKQSDKKPGSDVKDVCRRNNK